MARLSDQPASKKPRGGKSPGATSEPAKKNRASTTTKAGSASAKKKTTAKTAAVQTVITPEERRRMIAEAAYFRADQRNFIGGNPEQDWLDAEVEIDKLINRQFRRSQEKPM